MKKSAVLQDLAAADDLSKICKKQCDNYSRSMSHYQEKIKPSELLRNMLVEVVSLSNVCEGRPIRVIPRSLKQFECILRLCHFHRVEWALEKDQKTLDEKNAIDVDVVLLMNFIDKDF